MTESTTPPTTEPTTDQPVLVLNAGSSSLKYQLVVPESGHVLASGTVERIGEGGGGPADHAEALQQMQQRLRDDGVDLQAVGLRAVGHRVVHGGPDFSDPVLVDDEVLSRVRDLVPLAPLHNPGAITGIEAAQEAYHVPQVAVFDTAFFSDLPAAAATYALPRDLAREHRLRRYGFHGTSHRYVAGATADLLGRPLADLDQVVLHLGNGCSASAVHGGRAVDTSMGLTPLEGLVMGTRSGDVDPGLHAFLHREAGLSLDEVDELLNKRSGLQGLAGVNDFREVVRRKDAGDDDARLAFDVFVHRLKHYVGAYLAQLGRLDVLVFTAGIGQNSPPVRAAVVEGLGGLGLSVDPERNEARSSEARVISPDGSPVTVAVVPTNEELAIARQAAEVLSRG
ncbi:acetate/propionate family kinase [Terracoccus luteus]|uniref:Acetate kinase n=1 Tax=Terracoccus luteus TaxID=53356 RepID=A0A839PTC7_9MICO|nr:acetate kinase [Terracoccus luteus]MBB2986014.1 acetate kinase [Terracoccus luteus]MCP2171666.1 acetate kinase [Terracoccus luteus]